jgi:hypothetical protein
MARPRFELGDTTIFSRGAMNPSRRADGSENPHVCWDFGTPVTGRSRPCGHRDTWEYVRIAAVASVASGGKQA